jgi:hypothetical protein
MRIHWIAIVFGASSVVGACNDAVDLNAATSAAFISGAATLDSSCKPQVDRLLGSGTFDIGPDRERARPSVSCAQSYAMHLVVDSMSDELTLFDQAEVSLKDPSSGSLFAFDTTPEQMPNPYKVLASGRIAREAREGVVPVDVIPGNYAAQMAALTVDGVSVEVRLSGVTQSGARVASQVFRFPVSICVGCLTQCRSDFPNGSSEEDVYGDNCADDARADGRICAESDC